MRRVTKEVVKELAASTYFERNTSPACMAILPYVRPEDTGVEIGVYKGDSSTLFLDHCRFMHLIDPCRPYPENPDVEFYTIPDEFLESVNRHDIGRFEFYEMMSSEAAPRIPEVDFVFIDGNHAYDFVMDDIRNYWPKVKPKGFISGHDYHLPSVSEAVNHFFRMLPVVIEQHQRCWLVIKP